MARDENATGHQGIKSDGSRMGCIFQIGGRQGSLRETRSMDITPFKENPMRDNGRRHGRVSVNFYRSKWVAKRLARVAWGRGGPWFSSATSAMNFALNRTYFATLGWLGLVNLYNKFKINVKFI